MRGGEDDGTSRCRSWGHSEYRFLVLLLPFSLATGVAGGCSSGIQTLALLPTGLRAHLDIGCSNTFVIPWATCPTDSYLHVELWDLGALRRDRGPDHGDPMLMLARGKPPQPYSSRDSATWAVTWSFNPPETLWDSTGFMVSHPFMSVQVDYMQDMDVTQGANLGCDPGGSCWYIVVANIDQYTKYPLDYNLRVTCRDVPSCPSPSLGPEPLPGPVCSGLGQCQVINPVCSGQTPCARCICPSGRAGTGCEVQVPILSNGSVVRPELLGVNKWDFYEIKLQDDSSTVLLELQRTSGNPFLILKAQGTGYEPYGLPSVNDADDYGDVDSVQSNLDYHHILRHNLKAGTYYVGVWNMEGREVRQPCNYTLKLTVGRAGGSLCPLDCNSRGSCNANTGQCMCDDGYGGRWCEGPLQSLLLGSMVSGYLRPGQWTFFQMVIRRDSPLLSQGLLISFASDGGHAILSSRMNNWPTLNASSHVWWAGEFVLGDSAVLETASSLAPGNYVIGIYNLDYLLHQAFHFRLQVVPTGHSANNVMPYIWIIIGLLFLVLLSAVAWIYRRTRMTQRRRRLAEEALSRRAPTLSGPVGLDPAMVLSFPTFEYGNAAGDGAASERRASCGDRGFDTPLAQSEVHPSCSVCLGDYEKGELILRLPGCQHEFHEACIQLWLAQNTTCPICRHSLLPPTATTPEHPASVSQAASALLRDSPAERQASSSGEGRWTTSSRTVAVDNGEIEVVVMGYLCERGGSGTSPSPQVSLPPSPSGDPSCGPTEGLPDDSLRDPLVRHSQSTSSGSLAGSISGLDGTAGPSVPQETNPMGRPETPTMPPWGSGAHTGPFEGSAAGAPSGEGTQASTSPLGTMPKASQWASSVSPRQGSDAGESAPLVSR
eukprot:jgi/Botrbrau1/836/Bobra.0352s0031.2